MFRAPLDSFFASRALPAFVDQLLSEDALTTTGRFRNEQVQFWRRRVREGPAIGRGQRSMIQLGLVGVFTTQLWYHTFIQRLADLPIGWQTSNEAGRLHADRDRVSARLVPATSPV